MTPRDADQRALIQRRRTTLLVSIVAIAAVVAAVSGHGSSHTSRNTPPSGGHTRPASPPFRFAETALALSEPATSASATGSSPSGGLVRTVPVVVRYPLLAPGQRARFPLIVFSQGYDIPTGRYDVLLDAWVRAGYVVADPTYPKTAPPAAVDESDIVNHPADLRFVISSVLDAARRSGSPLFDLIDPGEVAVVGHSDGGEVSLAVAANSCCIDHRVRATVVLSGSELAAFGGSYYGGAHVPLLVVQGDADAINVPGCSAQVYDGAPQPKYFLEVPRGGHRAPYINAGPQRAGVASVVTAFLDAFLKREPGGLRGLSRPGRLPAGEELSSGPTAPSANGQPCPGAP